MITWVVIFAVSVIGAISMLVWRYRQIKKGQIKNMPHPKYPHLDFEILRGQIFPRLKNYGYKTVVLSLKIWMHGAHEIKKQKEKIIPKLRTKFHKIFKHHAYIKGGNQPVSKFLDSLNNYKERLRKIKEKIREDLE